MRRALLALLLACPAAAADKSAPKDNAAEIAKHYQDALELYAAGDYRRAIGKWTEVLRADPAQKSASSMILEARAAIEKLTVERRRKTAALIASGEYQKALLEVQALLDQDPGDPRVGELQSRLESVIKVAPALPPAAKAERMAVLGLKGWLSLPPDARLAHDALRRAVELAPDDARPRAFLDLLLAERPELAEDAVTPTMTLLEHLHAVALHDIYDGKHHDAVRTLNRVLALEPDDLVALKRLGSAYYSLGRKSQARAAWTRALRLAPKDETLRKFLARVEK